jgi:hypothetical protein
MPPVDATRLPTTLLERFAGEPATQLIAFLSFLGPVTAGSSESLKMYLRLSTE